MTADEFLDKLEQRALVPGDVVASLRQQVAKSLRIVPPESLAKLLVDKKRLTHDQAQQLISGRVAKIEDEELLLAPLDDELRLAPLNDGPRPKPKASAAPTKAASASTAGGASGGTQQSTGKSAAAGAQSATKPNTAAPAKPAAAPAASKLAAAAKPAGQAAASAAATAFKSPTGKTAPAAKTAGAAGAKPKTPGAADDPFGLGAAPSMDDLLPEPQLGEAAATQGNPLQLAKRRRQGVPSWVWIASGVGAVVVIGAIVAISILTRSNGDAEWKLAEKDYLGGADQEATYKLEAFVERFPHHPQASQARVYQEMARLRQVYAAKGDWEHPLTTAQEVLPQMVKEPAFPSVRGEVGKMLPEIAAGLTKQAEAGEKASLEQRRRQVELAQQALALAQDWRFVPASVAPWAMLHATADRVSRLAHDQARDAAFEQATTAITAASSGSKPADAIALRDKLVDDYPELRQDSRMLQINQDLAEASLKLVKPDTTTKPPETKPRPSPVVETVLVVPTRAVESSDKSPHPGPLPAGEGGSTILPLLIDGTVYWLRTDTGLPVGRRFIGFASVPPVAVDAKPDADTILFDGVHEELIRCGSSGSVVRWRLALGERVEAPPVVFGSRVSVATSSGKLLVVDAESGQTQRAVQLPGRVRAAPAVSPTGATLFVVTDSGTLYVISAKDLSALQATDLGHGAGSVVLPLVTIGEHVLVSDNSDWNNTTLRVFVYGVPAAKEATAGNEGAAAPDPNAPKVVTPPKDAKPSLQPQQTISLVGQLVAPPVVGGQKTEQTVYAATDRGELTALRSTDAAAAGSLGATAIVTATPTHEASFAAAAGRRVWLTSNGVTCFRADDAGGGYQKAWTTLADYRVQQPPALRGDVLIVVARRPGRPGFAVVGISADDGSRRWEIVLAAPPAGGLEGDATTVHWYHSIAGSQNFIMSDVDTAAGKLQVRVAPPNSERSSPAMDPVGALAALPGFGGALVERLEGLDRPADRLWIVQAKSGELQRSPWTDPVDSPPVGVAGGLLLANPAGQMCLIDPTTGKSLADPFQPLVAPGAPPQWLRPAAVPELKEAVVADRQGHVFRLGIAEKPAPHLVAASSAMLAAGLEGDVAVNGEFAFVASMDGKLNALGLVDLKGAKQWPLGGELIWGPRRVGKWVLLATESELLCFDSRPELLWHVPLFGGAPIDTPLVDGKNFLVATTDGVVARVDQATGQVKSKLELDQPLAGGPVQAGALWVFTARDGSLLFVKP